jgi:hypothetical protein
MIRSLTNMLRRLILSALAGTVLLAQQAFAADSGFNFMIGSAPGGGRFCMDVVMDRHGNGTPIQLYQCHGHENQRWTITRNMDGTSSIIGTGGLCLDVRGRDNHDGTPVQLWDCHFGDNQRFRMLDDGRIQEVRSGKCLMVLPEWGGGREHAGEPAWVVARMHQHDYEHVRFSERNEAPIIIEDCEDRALQFWRLMR